MPHGRPTLASLQVFLLLCKQGHPKDKSQRANVKSKIQSLWCCKYTEACAGTPPDDKCLLALTNKSLLHPAPAQGTQTPWIPPPEHETIGQGRKHILNKLKQTKQQEQNTIHFEGNLGSMLGLKVSLCKVKCSRTSMGHSEYFSSGEKIKKAESKSFCWARFFIVLCGKGLGLFHECMKFSRFLIISAD